MQQIARIALENYRNLSLKEGMTLRPLNIFIGPNGSGKSNLIKMLRFLQDTLGSNDTDMDLTYLDKAYANLGFGRAWNVKAVSDVPLGISISFVQISTLWVRFTTELLRVGEFRYVIKSESLYPENEPVLPEQTIFLGQYDGIPYYVAHNPRPSEGSVLVYSNPMKSDRKLQSVTGLPTDRFTFHALNTALLESAQPAYDTPYHEQKWQILKFVRNWKFYNSSFMSTPNIGSLRPKLGLNDSALSESGDNLLTVLYNLVKEFVDFEDELQDAMTQLFPITRKFRVMEENRVSVKSEWYVADNAEPFYFDEMSDGTIRMLCWAAILLSPKPASLIVLDEPEMGIHPAWLRVLAGWIKRASLRTQVILSTHSADLLDYFTEERESVYVFSPDPKNLTSNIVKSLSEERMKPKLEEGWQLGDLYRVGDPSIGGWPW